MHTITCTPRGPLSETIQAVLTGADAPSDLAALARTAIADAADTSTQRGQLTHDDDVQFALFLLYASAYGSLDEQLPALEWDTDLINARRIIERAFEWELRDLVPMPPIPNPDAADVARALFTLTGEDSGPSVARFIAKRANEDQLREFLILRSIYTLREADPHSWAIPRLRGRAKAALVEIQADEYGGGRPDRVHAEIFAKTMRGAGLDDRYGAYLDAVPAVTLASQNMMSMFGLNRRLVGAIVGHLAAFEMTSSIPNRLYGDGFRRLGFGDDVTDYFDEHVEADAVHEQIAGRDLAGSLAEDRPELLPDIMFGAVACLTLDSWVGEVALDRWEQGESALRTGMSRATLRGAA